MNILIWIYNHYIHIGFITLFIGSFRFIRGRNNMDVEPLDVLVWCFLWPIYLPQFLVRWTKYFLKGKRL